MKEKTGNIDKTSEELFSQGISFYNSENFAYAFYYLSKAAEAGNADAREVLESLCLRGNHPKMDLHIRELLEHLTELGEKEATRELAEYRERYKLEFVESLLNTELPDSAAELPQARKQLEELADKGNRGAMQLLGNMYYTGRMGYEQDYTKAREWYEKSAAIDDDWALCYLGYIYYYGRDVEIDYEKAFSLFARSAYKGNYNAMYKMGDHYYNGIFVKRNYHSAFYWYQRARVAAEEAVNYSSDSPELPNVLYRLGLCFAKGHGVEKDLVLSLHYLGKAEPMFYHKILAENDLFAKGTLKKTQKLSKKVRKRLDDLAEGKDAPGKKRAAKIERKSRNEPRRHK